MYSARHQSAVEKQDKPGPCSPETSSPVGERMQEAVVTPDVRAPSAGSGQDRKRSVLNRVLKRNRLNTRIVHYTGTSLDCTVGCIRDNIFAGWFAL